jgi:RNA polymerase sigma factor (sigma-70 family)
MPNAASAISTILLKIAKGGDSGEAPSDDELLARYVANRDGEAFARLVRRHGPMLLAVCRRLVGDADLAEDAFQAVFLVLARRASDVKPGGALRGWLYGVAVRTAKEARTIAARRRAREFPVPNVPDRPAPVEASPDADALRALDEEIGRLPDYLRAAVILFEIDGLSRRDVANRLGIPYPFRDPHSSLGRPADARRGSRRGRRRGCGPAVGQQVVEVVRRMGRQAREQVAQVGERIELVALAG